MSDTERCDVWEARLNVNAVSVLPWEQNTPVEAHIDSEGISL